jgi:hypothetical protein
MSHNIAFATQSWNLALLSRGLAPLLFSDIFQLNGRSFGRPWLSQILFGLCWPHFESNG